MRALIALLMSTAACSAADFDVIKVGTDTVIEMTGPIQNEDYDRLVVITKSIVPAHTLLKLNSTGGRIDPSIRIGYLVRTRKWATTVDGTCQSACALIWLAGTERYLPQGAAVGFHQPYNDDGSIAVLGVARMGAYLNAMGYNDITVSFAVSAGPKSMRWIKDAKDAAYAGITVTPLFNANNPQPAYISPWPVANGR